jgi:hypothetical protein
MATESKQHTPGDRCDLFKERVGYRGQRYEHSCLSDDEDRRIVLGWSDTQNDPAFANMVDLRPGFSQYECVDLEPEETR